MRNALTGSRIRERRLIAGLRQSELAKQVGISASYLNLIEHNRRRIGGKVLVDIAAALSVEPSLLTQGIEASLISALRESAADAVGQNPEVDGLEEFAGRFPGWAGVLAQMHRRVVSLERTVVTLSDRLTHDPHLAASMHEVLSTAAAIRSTAAILADTQDIDSEWQDRFHRNLHQDSERLADSSKALVAYLDDSNSDADPRSAPLEEVETFFETQGHHFPEIEDGGDFATIELNALGTEAARSIARELLQTYQADARAMPLDAVLRALEAEADPLALARIFSVDPASVLRRLASLPEDVMARPTGLVVCDASGTVLFYKRISGFSLPRHGEACPFWPLYTALNRPMVPIRKRVTQLGRSSAQFDCYAYAWLHSVPGYDHAPNYRSIMLVQPVPEGETNTMDAVPVGSSCRVCSSGDCESRREPSILSEGF